MNELPPLQPTFPDPGLVIVGYYDELRTVLRTTRMMREHLDFLNGRPTTDDIRMVGELAQELSFLARELEDQHG